MIFVHIDGAGSGPMPPSPVTWNQWDRDPSIHVSGDGLTASKSGGLDGNGAVRATLARPAEDAGGHYFEVLIASADLSPYVVTGVATLGQPLNNYIGSGSEGWSYYQEIGTKITGGAGSPYGDPYATGDVIGVLMKAGSLYFRKNGVWQGGGDPVAGIGAAFSGLVGDLYPAVTLYRGGSPAHQVVGRFAVSDLSGSLPAGASAWES